MPQRMFSFIPRPNEISAWPSKVLPGCLPRSKRERFQTVRDEVGIPHVKVDRLNALDLQAILALGVIYRRDPSRFSFPRCSLLRRPAHRVEAAQRCSVTVPSTTLGSTTSTSTWIVAGQA